MPVKPSSPRPEVDRPLLLKIALEAQLDPRTVRRALDLWIEALQSDHSKARLRAALRTLKLEALIP
jgi:hypothetical protein